MADVQRRTGLLQLQRVWVCVWKEDLWLLPLSLLLPIPIQLLPLLPLLAQLLLPLKLLQDGLQPLHLSTDNCHLVTA